MVFKAIEDVRLAARLHREDLKIERFEVDVKGREEIQDILSEYVNELHQRKWVDRAGGFCSWRLSG